MNKDILKSDLRICEWEEIDGQFILKLPKRPLEDYPAFKKWMVQLGGKYKKCTFVFDRSPKPEFDALMLEGKLVNPKKDFQAFFTPASVVQTMRDLVCADMMETAKHNNNSLSALEPSAGVGNILFGISTLMQDINIHWEYCEIQMRNAMDLLNRSTELPIGHKAVYTFEPDFLQLPTTPNYQYNFVIGNPPYSKGQDITHTRKMVDHLKEGGKLCVVLPFGVLFNSSKKYKSFRKFFFGSEEPVHLDSKFKAIGQSRLTKLPEQSFKDSGTNIDLFILQYTKQ
mgnify:CR=1 FL=1